MPSDPTAAVMRLTTEQMSSRILDLKKPPPSINLGNRSFKNDQGRPRAVLFRYITAPPPPTNFDAPEGAGRQESRNLLERSLLYYVLFPHHGHSHRTEQMNARGSRNL